MNRIMDLEEQLSLAVTDGEQIQMLNELAWELRIVDEGRAREFAERAYRLSSPEDGSNNDLYRQERAASLITLGSLDRHSGNLEDALSQLYSGLGLLEGFPPSKVLCQAWTAIAWTYAHLGDYPQAATFAAQAVGLARELNLEDQEAFGLDVQASVYYLSSEPEQAYAHFRQAITILERSKNRYIKCFVLNNMSLTLTALGEFNAALAAAQESLQLAHEQSLLLQEYNVADTMAQILLAMGDHAKAERYLSEALTRVRKDKFDIFQVYILSNLGKAHLGLGNIDQAAIFLQRAVLAAATVAARSEEAGGHKLLSEVYESQGLHREALEHFKKFHTMNEAVMGEKVARRLSAQRVAHELESARREAEMQRQRATELERAMNDQRRMQETLERLATIDPLTEIYNRRHFYNLALKYIRHAIRYIHPLAVLMIDIDHFKLVNDRYGHAVGDEVIRVTTNQMRKTLRTEDVIGRLGGEEFAVILPETLSPGGVMVAERIRSKVAGLYFPAGSGEFSITISIGVTSSGLLAGNPVEILDRLLKNADHALYEAKGKGRNQTVLF